MERLEAGNGCHVDCPLRWRCGPIAAGLRQGACADHEPRGATGAGELRHHCAIGDRALHIIGVWELQERVRTRWASEEFEEALTSVGFPSPKTADMTILELYAMEPPL
jgi:hypothetical protein